jgi:hypothetical protein
LTAQPKERDNKNKLFLTSFISLLPKETNQRKGSPITLVSLWQTFLTSQKLTGAVETRPPLSDSNSPRAISVYFLKVRQSDNGLFKKSLSSYFFKNKFSQVDTVVDTRIR